MGWCEWVNERVNGDLIWCDGMLWFFEVSQYFYFMHCAFWARTQILAEQFLRFFMVFPWFFRGDPSNEFC